MPSHPRGRGSDSMRGRSGRGRLLLLAMLPLIALIWFPTLHAATSVSPSTDSRWEAAARALATKDASHAVEGFNQWIDEQRERGIQSPEAHYNLGLAYWDLKQPGPAIFHILKSSTLRRSPLRIGEDIRTLAALEREIGIKDSLPDQFLFRFWLFANPDLITWLLALAVWSFAGALLWRWYHKSSPSTVGQTWGLASLCALSLLVAVSATLNRRYLTHVGVLIGDGGVPLYRTPPKGTPVDPDLKLADLPSGTIVSLGKIEDGYWQITQPVTGWISSPNLKSLSPGG